MLQFLLLVISATTFPTISATPNLSAAKINEIVGNVKGKEMTDLVKNLKAARCELDKAHIEVVRRTIGCVESTPNKAEQKSAEGALEAVRAITNDALPQLLLFLVKDGYRCLQANIEKKEYAYICHTDKDAKPLLGNAETIIECLTASAKSSEEKSLLVLFDAKLHAAGGYCAAPGEGKFRADNKLKTLLEGQPAVYKKELAELKQKFANDDRLATIQPESIQAVAAGFLHKVFDNHAMLTV